MALLESDSTLPIPVLPSRDEFEFRIKEVAIEFFLSIVHLRENLAGRLGSHAINGLGDYRTLAIRQDEVR